jgi:hypothetical protein
VYCFQWCPRSARRKMRSDVAPVLGWVECGSATNAEQSGNADLRGSRRDWTLAGVARNEHLISTITGDVRVIEQCQRRHRWRSACHSILRRTEASIGFMTNVEQRKGTQNRARFHQRQTLVGHAWGRERKARSVMACSSGCLGESCGHGQDSIKCGGHQHD